MIILIGAGGSGKDYFANFLKQTYNKASDYTTRPKRSSETDEYIWCSEIPYEDCYSVFKVKGRDWEYGYSKTEILKSDFCILPPSVIKDALIFLNSKGITPIVVWFNIDETIRKERLLKRNDGDVERRLQTDKQDFKNIEKYVDIIITDPFFKPTEILEKIYKYEQNY